MLRKMRAAVVRLEAYFLSLEDGIYCCRQRAFVGRERRSRGRNKDLEIDTVAINT